MKTKLMIISILTAACIFVFSGATWAQSKKDRRNKNPQKKHYVVAKQAKPVVHLQNRWRQASRSQDVKHRYHKRFSQRGKYHHPGSYDRKYRHRPYYRHFGKYSRYYKPRHYIQRPVKKYHRNRHPRPIYRRPHGNVAILAGTSHHGWSIKISSRD
jgi:hypothetical protein